MAKFGMSMCVLGMARRVRADGHRGQRALAAHHDRDRGVQNLLGGDEAMRRSRKPEIMADAAHAILTSSRAASCTGNFLIDDEVLAEAGMTDFSQYAVDPSVPASELAGDFFL